MPEAMPEELKGVMIAVEQFDKLMGSVTLPLSEAVKLAQAFGRVAEAFDIALGTSGKFAGWLKQQRELQIDAMKAQALNGAKA